MLNQITNETTVLLRNIFTSFIVRNPSCIHNAQIRTERIKKFHITAIKHLHNFSRFPVILYTNEVSKVEYVPYT